MSVINPENYFYVANGAVLKDLNETLHELKAMSPETFQHHVNSGKNDFASWIRDILNDTKLANKISSVTDQSEMASIINTVLTIKPKKASRNRRDIISSIKQRIVNGE